MIAVVIHLVVDDREAVVMWKNNANTLLVLAGQKYVEPLKERGVFEYGIARMTGDPNQGFKLLLETRFLFEEIENSGMFDQMSWMSNAIGRLEQQVGDSDLGDQQEFDEWAGERQECAECGCSPDGSTLIERDGTVYCEDCHPRRCARCDEWTTENGFGAYPLCTDCQTERGGQKREPLHAGPTEQTDIMDSLTATDGGDEL